MKSHMRILVSTALAAGIAACSPQGTSSSIAAPPAAARTAGASAPTATVAPPAPASTAAALPGGTIDQAASAAIGASIDGEIRKPDQNDFYRFDVPLKQRDLGIVRLQNKSTTLKPDFKLFNADRSGLAESYDGTPGASVERTIALEPGQAFYVEVQNYGTTGRYTLSVTPQNAFDSHEPNDDILSATPIAIGTPIDANIMDDKDTDWYRITGATQKSVHVTFDNQSTTLKPDVKMFSASKSGIGEKYDGTPGANLDFVFDVEPGKDFYLQVLPYGSAGKYRLTVKPEPGQTAPPAAPSAAAEPATAAPAAAAPVNAAAMTSNLASSGQVTLYGIYFDFDKADIKPESKPQIDEIAKLLASSPELKLRVLGYTDNKGRTDHNLKLSQRRAESIVAALVKNYGIAANRLNASGVGSAAPVASNDTEEGRAKNRRVELLKL